MDAWASMSLGLEDRANLHHQLGNIGTRKEMPRTPKLSVAEYYEQLPAAGFRAGDIWRNVPTFGLLGRELCEGVVITPACDLSNRKTETITFLPIIPVVDYLTGHGFVSDLLRAIRAQLSSAEIEVLHFDATSAFEAPRKAAIQMATDQVSAIAQSLPPSAKRRVACERVVAGLNVLAHLCERTHLENCVGEVKTLMGEKEFNRVVQAIVKNNHSADIHFLPMDGRSSDLSVMQTHSVALFRYPLPLPSPLLTLADDINVKDWEGAINEIVHIFPVSKHLKKSRPLRVSTLKPRFFSDLLARFVALHVRMGSPDFSNETVDEFVRDLGAN